MAKPATLDGYRDQYTVDCERVLVTLLRGLGPWKESVFLVGGLTPRYLVTARPPSVPAHAGTLDVDIVIDLQILADTAGYHTLEENLRAMRFERSMNDRGQRLSWWWQTRTENGALMVVELLADAPEVAGGRVEPLPMEGNLSALNIPHSSIVFDLHEVTEIRAELLGGAGIAVEAVGVDTLEVLVRWGDYRRVEAQSGDPNRDRAEQGDEAEAERDQRETPAERRGDATGRLGEWPFEIGLWVGKAGTPNQLGEKGDGRSDSARAKVSQYKNNPRGRPTPIPMESCPWCGVASTATVRHAREQIQALFARSITHVFPPPGPERRDTWFARTMPATEKHARRYFGVAAQGRNPKEAMRRVLLALMGAATWSNRSCAASAAGCGACTRRSTSRAFRWECVGARGPGWDAMRRRRTASPEPSSCLRKRYGRKSANTANPWAGASSSS